MSKPREIDEDDLTVGGESHAAVGLTGVTVAMKRSLEEMGPLRTARTLPRLNQAHGFDCQGCAWPDPPAGERKPAEFCENGAKAVAEEATLATCGPEFFAAHSVSDLRDHTEYWLGKQGRLTHPMYLAEGATHYEPISWEDAFSLIGGRLAGLASPDEAVFYTSGKTSNEAAFAYQLFVRAYGTNNLPDCSNMCHESTSVALAESIGIGKGSVSLEDIHSADLIVIAGQNPGTNHPRMLTALEHAKKRGAKIISINPLREAGLVAFKNPQSPVGLMKATQLADLHLPVRLGGDLALFQALGHLLVEADALDHEFIAEHTTGFEAWRDHVADLDWDEVIAATGLERGAIEEAARLLVESDGTVYCWAMGITQHRNAVATIKEIANLAFARGDIGKPGAGLCPVRGHSNVQGDRTMGIWEKPKPEFLDSLAATFGFEPPREHGLDTVDAVRAFADGRGKVFFGMGGNFVSAVSDTTATEAALARADLTVQVSTKLNRSHLVTGREALILPTMGRSERDLTGGRTQKVTVEDSMSHVHASAGPLAAPSPHLRSEVDIVCSLAEATLAGRSDATGSLPWADFRADYGRIRDAIASVVPGCEDFGARATSKHGFTLPHPPRDSRTFPNAAGKAEFVASPLAVLDVPDGHVLLQTLRSHDQFNTTIYGLEDRYRGISGGRRVVFMHTDDIAHLGFVDGDLVDLFHDAADGRTLRADRFRIVTYDQPRGCAAAYYPETNPLIPLDSVAKRSNTPVSKAVVIRLERAAG